MLAPDSAFRDSIFDRLRRARVYVEARDLDGYVKWGMDM